MHDQEFSIGKGESIRNHQTDLALVRLRNLNGDCSVVYHKRVTKRGEFLGKESLAELAKILAEFKAVYGVGNDFDPYVELPPVNNWTEILSDMHPGLKEESQNGVCKKGIFSSSMNFMYYVLGLRAFPLHESSDALGEAQIFAALMRFGVKYQALGSELPSAAEPPTPHPNFSKGRSASNSNSN